MEEQAVIIRFSNTSGNMDALFELEDQLENIISSKDIGEYDGHEVSPDTGETILYMYGPDADQLFQAVRPAIKAAGSLKNGIAKLRYGSAGSGARETEVPI